MEPVFRALADPTRRELLDELFRSDGQTLAALTSRFTMTTRARYQFGAQIESD